VLRYNGPTRKRVGHQGGGRWVPAFAGMTNRETPDVFDAREFAVVSGVPARHLFQTGEAVRQRRLTAQAETPDGTGGDT